MMTTLPLFTLTDETGGRYGTEQMRGNVSVVSFIFTRCGSSCETRIANLARIQELLKDDPAWEEVRLVSVSVDPEHDTPGKLEPYGRRVGADPDHWKFLTGDRDRIWKLGKRGFRVATREAPGAAGDPVFDSDRFLLVDRRGNVRGSFDGESAGTPDDLVASVRTLLAESLEYGPPESYPGIDLDGAAGFARPDETFDPPWLEGRRLAQQMTLDQFEVFHEFRFVDERRRSGITFRHKVTDDGSWVMKPVHYDHGNGIVIADVDLDGHHDIYFLNQIGANELWRSLGDGRFENVTERAGVALADPISVTGSFADTDNDGDPDLYVTTVREGNHFFENKGDGTFRDISEAAGLAHVAHSSSPVFFDYDRDGLLDVFLTNVGKYTTDTKVPIRPLFPEFAGDARYEYWIGYVDAFSGHLKAERHERSILYRNLGGNRFEDVSQRVGLVDMSWSGDASPIDVNRDGWQDLYVPSMQGHDEYYENVGGKRFVRKSREVFPKTPWGAMGIKVFDYNNDGHMDIYVTDMHSDMMEDIQPEREKLKSRKMWPESMMRTNGMSIFGNALFEGRGDETFEEVSDEVGAENYWPWGLSTGDLNADGWEDVFIASSMNLAYRYGVNSLLLNNHGRFLDSEFILGVEPRGGSGPAMPWFELQCPEPGPEVKPMGWGEHFVNACCEGRSGRVVVWGAKGTRTSVIFDYDEDGDLDIVTCEYNALPLVLTSNLAETKPDLRFLKIKLTGTLSNRDGLGAWVTVVTENGAYHKVHDGKSGYMSQSSHPLYFGLGDAGRVDRIEVTWPSGGQQTLDGPIEVNRQIEIVEPSWGGERQRG